MAGRTRKSPRAGGGRRNHTVRAQATRKKKSFLPLAAAVGAVFVCALVIVVWYALKGKSQGASSLLNSVTQAPTATADLAYPGIQARAEGFVTPSVTANPETARDLSYLAQDATFTEKQINAPGVYGNEIFFSAGTGSLDANVLTKLYLYNLETKTEEKIATTAIYMGEYYETLINDKWLVYLETDHGKKNNIYVRDRSTGVVTLLKTCTNGKPKLRLFGDTLIWMEQEEEKVDYLYMVDLVSQENLTLFTFEDVATYGVSAPAVYEDWIVWAAPDPAQTQEERDANEHSSIYYLNISCDFSAEGGIQPRIYSPGAYVHEPQFNGKYFLWIDTNKSFDSNLYLAAPGDAEPLVIADKVTAYGIGDDIVVYGKDSVVWLYIISTGETCRLTSENERGILPQVNGRTVIWQNTAADGSKDTLRFKVLTDEDLYPYGKPADNTTPNPALVTPDPTPTATPDPDEGEVTQGSTASPGPSPTPAEGD